MGSERCKKVNGISSGPVNWAALYSTANHDVIQQGGSSRGALMIMINDWHPDIEEFINRQGGFDQNSRCKSFRSCFRRIHGGGCKDGDWDLVFPDISYYKYDEEWDGDLDGWKQRVIPF